MRQAGLLETLQTAALARVLIDSALLDGAALSAFV